MQRTMRLFLGALIISTLSGCALLNRATVTQTRTTTIGKELIDLQSAKDQGIVTDEEFNLLKKEIMKGGPSIDATSTKKCECK